MLYTYVLSWRGPMSRSFCSPRRGILLAIITLISYLRLYVTVVSALLAPSNTLHIKKLTKIELSSLPCHLESCFLNHVVPFGAGFSSDLPSQLEELNGLFLYHLDHQCLGSCHGLGLLFFLIDVILFIL